MNRRGFLSTMLKAGIGAMVLPSAATYVRRWGPVTKASPLVVPYWVQTQRYTLCYDSAYMDSMNAGKLLAFYAQQAAFNKSIIDTNYRCIIKPTMSGDYSFEDSGSFSGTGLTDNKSTAPAPQSENSLPLPPGIYEA